METRLSRAASRAAKSFDAAQHLAAAWPWRQGLLAVAPDRLTGFPMRPAVRGGGAATRGDLAGIAVPAR